LSDGCGLLSAPAALGPPCGVDWLAPCSADC
jgi:hypothetical protein